MRKGSHLTAEQRKVIKIAMNRPETKERLRLQKIGDLNPAKRQEVKEKIGKTLKIRYANGDKQPTKYWTGKKMTKEHRLKMGQKGCKNHFWKGGIFEDKYPNEFNNYLKELIRERDGYTCQSCGKPSINKELAIHHKDLNKYNNSLNNLVSLCNSCHARVHNKIKKEMYNVNLD
jgi:formate-dependent nitrite reductase cytochrome c552 subunit